MDEIKEKLKEALNITCKEAFEFSDKENAPIEAEYLLTVNAAKSIKGLNKHIGAPYKIYFEHSTEEFCTNCIPIWKKEEGIIYSIFNKTIMREKIFNTSRNGKIDIAIYIDSTLPSKEPFCAIEIKGFNPLKGKIIDDLKRNYEYFSLVGNTGESNLKRTYFLAIHQYKRPSSSNKEKLNKLRIKNRYENYIKEIMLPLNVKHDIDVFTIQKGKLPDVDDPYFQEFGLDGTENYHFMGVIVKFEKG